VVVMSGFYPPSGEDRAVLEGLRDELKAQRLQRNWTYGHAAAQVDRSHNFLYEMENLRSGLKMDNLQLWASIYDLRIEFSLDGFWNFVWPHDELTMLYQLSRPFDAKDFQRLWLVSALQAWRERLGITSAEVGYWMGLTAGAVTEWERTTSNPLMLRAMAQARMVKTSVTMKLWKREDWIFK
jgi:DNA-binding XRE family transcriptional regulator